jgi:hypothetical protein
MKVHILSMQRTGSKSLQDAINTALGRTLTIGSEKHLGEYFHGWSFHGYKFGYEAVKPFDPEHAILFRTHPHFKDFSGSSFLPVARHHSMCYVECHYEEVLTDQHIYYLRTLLNRYREFNYVVKTQIVTLMGDVEAPNDLWMDAVLKGFDVTINLMPSDLVKWLCSNFACDYTGIFAPCPEQEEARKTTKMAMPEDYARRMLRRLDVHKRLVNALPNVIHVETDKLSDPATLSALCTALKVSDLTIKHPKEFSAGGYETLFANYNEIVRWVESYNTPAANFGLNVTYPL